MAIRQLITNRRHRGIRVLLLVAAACAIQASWGSGSDLNSAAVRVTSASPELFADTLSAVHDVHLDSGAWQFPGMAWTMSQGISDALPAEPTIASSGVAVPNTATKLDGHVLALLQSMAGADVVDSNFQRYRLVTPDLRIIAWTVVRDDGEIPVSLQCCWPAHGGSWMTVDAQRIDNRINPAEPTSWGLPPECETIASRVSDSGQVQCRLVAVSTAAATVPEIFAAQGWRVEEPPNTTGLTGLFRASSHDGNFEINVRDVPSGRSCTALIRRL